MARVLFASALCLIVSAAHAQRTINVPGDFDWLNQALDPAISGIADGDTVLVSFSSQFNAVPITITVPNITVRGTRPDAGARLEVSPDGGGTFFIITSQATGFTLENMTLSGGSANQVNGASADGGGIRVQSAEVTVIDCVFLNHSAEDDGGAIAVSNGTATIRGSRFIDNEAKDDGGAIYLADSTALIEDCTFVDNRLSLPNSSDNGGAIMGFRSSVTVIDSTFTDNTSNNIGGGMYFNDCTVELENCEMTGNTADRGGGLAFFNSGGGVLRMRINGNTASGRGGGLYLLDSEIALDRSEFRSNTAGSDGGAIAVEAIAGVSRWSNCLIVENSAVGAGGGIYTEGSVPIEARNFTIANNQAVSGGGINVGQSELQIILFNSIFSSNGPDPYVIDNPSADTGFYCTTEFGVLSGGNNIIADPMFVDAANGDYRVLPGAPGIDAGNTSFLPASQLPLDLAGEPRVMNIDPAAATGRPLYGGYVDHGAYEFQPAETPDCPADQNFDGLVTPADFGAWVANYNAGCG